MTSNDSGKGVRKNFKLLKYEHFVYHFKACDLEIPLNSFFARYLNFAKIRTKTNFSKFLKVFINRESNYIFKSPDYVLQRYIQFVHILKV